MKKILKKSAQTVLGKRLYMKLWKAAIDTPKNLKREREIQEKNESSIIEYQEKFHPKIFIETGTYRGDMVNTMKDRFGKIYSIELGDDLYAKAKQRFESFPHIEIIHGDSGTELPKLLKRINEPALFWLDAHYSTGITVRANIDTPIEAELRTILTHPIKNHVILIDDARHFLGANGYPKAETIKEMASAHGYLFDMQKDNFRIYPKK